MGLMVNSFPFVCWVSNKNSFNDRDELDTVLSQEGAGELIHPFYGSKNVSVITHNIINEYGRAIFTIQFEETNNSILPIQDNKNKGFVGFVKNIYVYKI